MIGTEDYVSHAFRAKFTDAKTGRQNVVGENFTSDELLKEDSFNFGLTLFQAIAGVTQTDLPKFRHDYPEQFTHKKIKERITNRLVG